MVSKGKDNLDRWEKVKSRTSHMHAVRESYNPIVPSKRANEGPLNHAYGVATDWRSLIRKGGWPRGRSFSRPPPEHRVRARRCRVD
jgi:hypothetical protein